MKLSELMHLLQRYHDLYPGLDPEVVMTSVDYCASDVLKRNPEYNCHTCDIKLFETRTLVHIPTDSLFSERGPYLNIFYEKEYMDTIEDFWKNNYFQQHGQKQTGSTYSGSCAPAETGAELVGNLYRQRLKDLQDSNKKHQQWLKTNEIQGARGSEPA